MAAQRPEITFGSNVAVWRNEQGRSITIKPRQYKDKDGHWQSAQGWNVSDIAHLATCLMKALDHCLSERAKEESFQFTNTPQRPDDRTPDPPETRTSGHF